MGSEELQAKAFGIDWENIMNTFFQDFTPSNETREILRYIFNYFPRDSTYWMDRGFEGYSDRDGNRYVYLDDWLKAINDEPFAIKKAVEKVGAFKETDDWNEYTSEIYSAMLSEEIQTSFRRRSYYVI